MLRGVVRARSTHCALPFASRWTGRFALEATSAHTPTLGSHEPSRALCSHQAGVSERNGRSARGSASGSDREHRSNGGWWSGQHAWVRPRVPRACHHDRQTRRPATSMVLAALPKSAWPYAELMRLDKPIGTWLL